MTFLMLLTSILLAINRVTAQCTCNCNEICPDGWIRFMNSCYFIGFEQSLDFVESAHFCQQHHANLVNIETAIENAFIEDFLKKTKAGNTWIGLTDIDIEGIWRWYSNDNIAHYTDWFPGQPGSDGHEEDCAAILSDFTPHYKWHDLQCVNKYHPLCEKQLQANSETVIG